MGKSIEIYNFLLNNCVGYDNRVKASYLMERFAILDHKTLRSYIESARMDPACEYFIGSEAGSLGGYWIATNDVEKEITYTNLILRANKMKQNAKLMKRKRAYGT